MKDYTFELIGEEDYAKEHANFILNYDIYRDLKLIKVYYANGNWVTMDYNLENEKQLLEKMRTQVLAYKKIMLAAKERNMENKKDYDLTKVYLGTVALGCVLLLIKDIPIKLFGGFFFVLGTYLTMLEAYVSYSNYCDIDDFEKNILFIQNEEIIKEAINNDKEILLNLPIRILKGITCNAEGEVGFSINSISKLRCRDIENLLRIIDENKDSEKNLKKK